MTQSSIVKEGDPDDRLTSELIFLGGTANKKELFRRLELLKLTKEQQINLIASEENILKASGGLGTGLWANYNFIVSSTTKETLPSEKGMTLSELVLVIDDALGCRACEHETLPDPAFEAICHIIGNCEVRSPYDSELRARFDSLGLNRGQYIHFIVNESLIIKRLKWHYSGEKAWQDMIKETMQ